MTAPAAVYQVQSTRAAGPPPGSFRVHQAMLSTSAGSTGIPDVPEPDSAMDMGDVVFDAIMNREKYEAPFGPPVASQSSSTVAPLSDIVASDRSASGARFRSEEHPSEL